MEAVLLRVGRNLQKSGPEQALATVTGFKHRFDRRVLHLTHVICSTIILRFKLLAGRSGSDGGSNLASTS